MSGFAPTSFFAPPPTSSSAAEQVASSTHEYTKISEAASFSCDPHYEPDLSFLIGPHHSGKSRLLLQLAYQLGAQSMTTEKTNGAAGASSSSSSLAQRDLGDPYQPIVLILPKRRNQEEINRIAGSSNSHNHKTTPILPIFGVDQPATDVTNKIQIKWYANDKELYTIVCQLHSLSTSSALNASGVPPRFIGLMYDRTLNMEAARVMLVLARFCEALTTLTISDTKTSPFAPTQALWVQTLPSSIPRLATLLPRYARVMYETSAGPSASEYLLHTHMCVSPATTALSSIDSLLASTSSQQQQDGNGSSSPTAATSTTAGIPDVVYRITSDAVQIEKLQTQQYQQQQQQQQMQQ